MQSKISGRCTMKKFLLTAFAAIAIAAAFLFGGCSAGVNLTDYVSEYRSDIYIGTQENIRCSQAIPSANTLQRGRKRGRNEPRFRSGAHRARQHAHIQRALYRGRNRIHLRTLLRQRADDPFLLAEHRPAERNRHRIYRYLRRQRR